MQLWGEQLGVAQHNVVAESGREVAGCVEGIWGNGRSSTPYSASPETFAAP